MPGQPQDPLKSLYIISGEILTHGKLRKLVLSYCIKYNIPLKPSGGMNINTALKFSMNHDIFASDLKRNVKIFSKDPSKSTFWPTKVWLSRFNVGK